MQAEQILAFRLARSGLADRDAGGLAEAAACPASDFSRDAALLALAARLEGLTRERYDEATDGGDLVVAHVVRGAIHALAPQDLALYGRTLISGDDDELGQQLGQQVQHLAVEKRFAPTDALEEVAEATKDALGDGRALGKNDLHDELRERVGADLMPWCKGCKSHHVAPMLWRYGGVKAGARLDSERRYVLGRPGRAPVATEAVRRFLHYYGPATSGDFAEWAGLAQPHAQRLWADIEGALDEVSVGKRRAWALNDDVDELASPPAAAGIRLIPPGDPYLQKPNRSLLAPEEDLRKRLFRPVASPGAVSESSVLSPLRAALGSLVFLVLAPGIVAGLLPWMITGWETRSPWPPLQVAGLVLVVGGAAVLLHAFVRFVIEGLGTPAPVAPTERLVVGGLYRHVRNPMYLAVAATIVGQALILGRPVLLVYAAAFGAAVAAFVHAYEEPTLAKRYGEHYEAYRRAVPAWWPRRRPWDGR